MMKRILISTLTGSLIVFILGALSWMISPIHKHSLKYAPNQDKIMESLKENLSEDGYYAIPFYDPEKATEAEKAQYQKDAAGEPWALISYRTSFNENMGSNMAFGLIFELVSALIITLTLAVSRDKVRTFAGRFLIVMGFVLFILMQETLPSMNWWHTPAHFIVPEIIDHILLWGIAGIWFAWYMGRPLKKK